ncbi:RDD family protein [Microlunatus elymi]|uniref:RDD family protein n=1 Tax=Microlunatus elymi TaxID=2596828 RepID=UPI00143D7BF6|nr:RDD family protein [Microlunatus elymi]
MAPAETEYGDRSAGLPDGVHLARLGRRLAAFAIDVILPYLVLVIGLILLGTDGPNVPSMICGVLVAGWAALSWWLYATRAAGVGMRLLGLQVVGLHDGRPIGWGRALLRGVILLLLCASTIVLIIMAALMLTQRRRQGWHDLAADSVVIEARPLAPPRTKITEPAVAPAAVDHEFVSLIEEPDDHEPGDQHVDDLQQPARPVERTDLIEEVEPEQETRVAAAVQSSGEADPDEPAPLPPNQGWLVVLEDGRQVPINRLVLVGRNPQPRAGEDDVQLIKVVDEARTVSKTHLAINVDARGVSITDRGSTNGTAITDADGGYELLVPEVPRRIHTPGYLISFGKHKIRIARSAR